MTNKTTTITIVNNSRFSKVASRLLTVVAAVVMPIGLGIVTGSPAMQWAGFAFGLLLLLGMAVASNRSNSFSSVAAAKRRLDEMVANGEAE